MKTLIFTLALGLIEIYAAYSQCSFTPTVTPAAPILCPNSSDTLWTESYDSYQWYKNNNAIAGATDQYFVVTENDLLKKFKVAATVDTCTEFSEAVLVDGWVFLLPFVIHSGDLGYFDPITQTFILCGGDTMILTFGDPSAVNVQWYDGADPINGATDVVYYVTQSGSYTVCGAPAVCPDYIQCLGLTIDVTFSIPIPVITQSNDSLISNAFSSYQWFLNGAAIPGATNQIYNPSSSGSYAVSVTDNYGCSAISEPFDYIATGNSLLLGDEFNMEMFPNPVHDQLNLHFSDPFDGEIAIYDLSGKIIFHKKVENNMDVKIETSTYAPGVYILNLDDEQSMTKVRYLKD